MTTTSPQRVRIDRRARWAGAAFAVTAVALLAALGISGTAQPRTLGDPGPLVRWGLPAATVIHHLSMSVVLAALAFRLAIVPGATDGSRVHTRLAAVGRRAATMWVLSAAAMLAFCFADTIGQPLSAEAAYAGQFATYAWGTTPGRARLAVLALAVLVMVLLVARPGRTASRLAAIVTASAVVPLSVDGHALSAQVPWAAAGLMAVHVLGVAAWVGGVIVLGLLADLLRIGGGGLSEMGLRVFRRFSGWAGAAYAAVFASGVVTAVLRLGSFEAVATPYGVLLLLKTVAILGLGVIGYLHRRWITSATRTGPAPSAPVFRLVCIEILVMGSTIAVAVALGRTMPPMPNM